MEIVQSVLSFTDSHPFVSGGILSVIFWYILSQFQHLPSQWYYKLKSYFFISMEVKEVDEVYVWLKEWFNSLPASEEIRDIEVTSIGPQNDITDSLPNGNRKQHLKQLLFSPAGGTYAFIHNGRRVWFGYTQRGEGKDRTPSTITVTVFGRKQQDIKDILDDVIRLQREKADNTIGVYSSDYKHWRLLRKLEPRDLNTVILPKHQTEKLNEDIIKFKTNRQFYKDLSIPYRRGYLFHGVPGTGKTSVIHALASVLEMNICILNLSEIGDDSMLNELFSKIPTNSIVLIEDIDAFFKKRTAERRVKITFSGLLNALDGIIAPDGLMTCITSNHYDKLDKALIRTGRVDYQLEFGYADAYQIGLMFKRFFPSAPQLIENEFVRILTHKEITTSDLQVLLVKSDFVTDVAIQLAKEYMRVNAEEIIEEIEELQDEGI